MEVKVAKTAGFCFGVQRAVDKVYELIGSCPDRLFTLGPIIHNEEVVNDLEKKGVRVASEEDLKTLPEGSTVVIRSHGVGKEVYDQSGRIRTFLCGCDLSLCPEDPPDCGEREQGRFPYCDHWRSGSSGSCGNLRLVHGTLHGNPNRTGCTGFCASG